MMVQVIAYQKVNRGYIHVDTEYFKGAEEMRDWCSGAVEWADRFRIFKTGGHDSFFEADIVDKKVERWVQKDIEDYNHIIKTSA